MFQVIKLRQLFAYFLKASPEKKISRPLPRFLIEKIFL